MARKWFQLVGEDGNPVTSATSVGVDVEDVDTFRDAVFAKVSRALPANVIASDLAVFANRAAFDTKQALGPQAPLAGTDGNETLIVQVPQRTASEPSYFILPETREKVVKAVFVLVDEDDDHAGVGIGVFSARL